MYKIAEQTGDSTCKIVKGLSFKKFINAYKIASRLAGIHTDIDYIIINMDTKEQYKVSKNILMGHECNKK